MDLDTNSVIYSSNISRLALEDSISRFNKEVSQYSPDIINQRLKNNIDSIVIPPFTPVVALQISSK